MNHFPYAENRRSWHKFGEDTLPGWYNHQTWRDDVRSMILQNWEKYKLSHFWNLYTIWYFTVCVCVWNSITLLQFGTMKVMLLFILEKGIRMHSCILAWRILCSEEPAGLQSMESQELDTTEQLTHHTHTYNFVHIFTCMIYTCQGVKQLVLECTNH